jgi:hypothetical protein
MNTSFLDQTVAILNQEYPDLMKLCYPRRYVPPQGYPHPKFHAALIAAQLVAFSERQIQLDKTNIDCTLAAWSVIESGSPVYCVAEEFITALMMSDPPPDLKFADLLWPHNGFTVLLPERFQLSYFGHEVPYVEIARCPLGMHKAPPLIRKVIPQPGAIGYNPGPDGAVYDMHGIPHYCSDIDVKYNAFVCCAGIMCGDKPIEYAGSWPMDETVQQFFQDASFKDFTYANERGLLAPDAVIGTDEDLKIMHNLIALCTQLLFAMGQLPEHVEPDATCIRPYKEKKGGKVVKEALYTPPWIGKRYRYVRAEAKATVGTHASPRVHPRRGHWRYQAYGPMFSQRKWKFIDPIIVGAKGKDQP